MSDRPQATEDVIVQARDRSYAGQVAQKCVHFTGTGNKTCEAGVKYAEVELSHEPVKYRDADRPTVYTATRSLPCIKSHNYCGATCLKQRFPTPEEVAEKQRAMEASIDRTVKARRAITEAVKTKGNSAVIPCPNCGGSLCYARAASNGHVHARCSTADCVAFME